MDPFIGQIMLVGFNFAPNGWALCNGQLLSIAQNTTLFSLLGTTYGGNGQTTFALPDLRGRVPVGAGQGPGLQNYELGEFSGQETVTLTTNQMPTHSHAVSANAARGGVFTPVHNFLGSGDLYNPATDGSTMNPGMIVQAGGSQPHENRQPFLGLNYIIALVGIYPSRP